MKHPTVKRRRAQSAAAGTPHPAARARVGDAPARPAHMRASSWARALKRTASEFRTDDLTDQAAALTYYGVLAIFPALIALVSILGLVGHAATQPLIENLGKLAPGSARSIFTSAVENLQRSRGTAGVWPNCPNVDRAVVTAPM